jgi:hypothetical protein
MAKQQTPKRYSIPYLRDVDVNTKTAKIMMMTSFGFSLLVSIAAFIVFRDGILKQKDNPLVMDKNGEIRKTYDIYNDGYETVTKKALVSKGHELFFRLEPDERQILANIQQSFYLGDFRALYEFYQSQGYYNSIVQRNTIQYIKQDSIVFAGNLGRFYGKELVRGQGGVSVEKFLVTEFEMVQRDRTDNNLYGFYMDKVKVIKNNLVSEESVSSTSLNSINALKTDLEHEQ